MQAKKLYEAALQQHNATDIDAAVCRFRIAQIVEAAEVPKAAPVKVAAIAAYRAVYVQHPLHPLAELARQKMTELDAGTNITVAEHITRAKLMTAGRAWPTAVEELKALGNVGTPEELAEAEYWLGTTLFRMRHGYEEAAQKLLDVWNKLPGEERKAEALFHGVRAQSRADHDDQAILGYKDVVARFPHSKNAPEASFLIGWLQAQSRVATRTRSRRSRRRSPTTATRASGTTRAGISASRAGSPATPKARSPTSRSSRR